MSTPTCSGTHPHGSATATCALSQGHAGAHCNGAQPTLWWPNLTQPVLKPADPTALAQVTEAYRLVHAALDDIHLRDATALTLSKAHTALAWALRALGSNGAEALGLDQ